MSFGGFFVGQMEGLGIISARKLDHFLAGHRITAELGFVADVQIFEIAHGRQSIAAPRGACNRANLA